MIYCYNAGPLFSEADIKQRKYEGQQLRLFLSSLGMDFVVANPVDLPFDNTKTLKSSEIFKEDYRHIKEANVFFFELATNDPGTMVELGNVIEKYMNGKDITIYPVICDLRLSRNQASGTECPVGFNSYVVGCLTANHIPIYSSFEEALLQFKVDVLRVVNIQ